MPRVVIWMFAGLSTIEPPILDLMIARVIEDGESWTAQRLPLIEGRTHERLHRRSGRLAMPTASMARSAPVTFSWRMRCAG
jgi:hypothetical protein